MEILRRGGIGPKLQKLLHQYWEKQEVVPKPGKFFGRTLHIERGVTQGDPVSTTIFNIVVDSVVRAFLLVVFLPQEANHGFGWSVGEHKICFYADDGKIDGRNPIWINPTLTAMVRMFKRVGFQTNLGKTKEMICTPGFIWVQQGAAAYKSQVTGEGAKYWESKITRVSYVECRGTMLASSFRHHTESSHGIFLPYTRGVDVGGGGSDTYVVSFTWILKSAECPVEGCPIRANTPGRLRENFMYRCWKARVEIV